MPISTIRANAHRSYVSVSAAGRRGRRSLSDDSLFMRRISQVVEAPLDDVIALFDEFRRPSLSMIARHAKTSDEPGPEAPPQETMPAPETAASTTGASPERAASTQEAPPQNIGPIPEATASPIREAPMPSAQPAETQAAPTPEAAIAKPSESGLEKSSADRKTALRAARRRLRSKSAAQPQEPRIEEMPIFTETPWNAEPERSDEHEAFMARAATALSLPEEPLLARIVYEQNSAVFLTDDELRAESAEPQDSAPGDSVAARESAQASPAVEADEPTDTSVTSSAAPETEGAKEDEPPVREMVEEELEAESHISATGTTVNVYRMYDAPPTPEPAESREAEPTIEAEFVPCELETAAEIEDAPQTYAQKVTFEGEPDDTDAEAEFEAVSHEPEPSAEDTPEIYEAESTLEIAASEDEASSALPVRAEPWPWEEDGELSLEEALEALDDKELSGLTTEIVTNTVEGHLDGGAIKSLCRRYSLPLQAVYNAIQRESKRRISRMTEKHFTSSGEPDATRELGMRMAKKLLAAEMRGKRTWFKSPFPEADGRYYIIQSHRVEDEKLPIDFPTERVHYEELGDGWAISVGY